MVPEKRAQERSVRESEEILNPLRLFDAALVLVSDEAASPALDEYVRLHLLELSSNFGDGRGQAAAA